jgi:hypothetical protein
MILPENFNAPDMMAEKRKLVVGHWVIWKRLGYGRILIEEHFCQAVRGGTVAELLQDYPFKASPTHPLLVVLVEMDVLAVSTSEERAAEIAARVALAKPAALTITQPPPGCRGGPPPAAPPP